MLIRMAWRNLWRNRRRTAITLVSIIFGMFFSITLTTLSDGGFASMIDSAARMMAGHMIIEPKGYGDTPGVDLSIKDAESLAASCEGRPGVDQVSVRILGQAMASTASGSLGAAFYGIDPTKEKEAILLLNHVVEGEKFQGKGGRRALIGRKMAEQLSVKLKSKIVVTLSDKNGEVVTGLLRVGGIFETGVAEVDRSMMLVPIDWARELLGYGDKEATQVVVNMDNHLQSIPLAEAMSEQAALQGAVALAWNEALSDMSSIIDWKKRSNRFIQIIVLLLVGAGILNTVLMSVLERLREFGVMLAVGMSPGRLWWLVLLETFWMALIGMILGLIVSWPLYHYLSTTGLDMSEMYKEGEATIGNTLLDPVMKAILYPDNFVVILIGVFCLIMAAGLYPAWVATKIRPVDAIKIV